AADLTRKKQTDKAGKEAEAMAADLREGKSFEESAGRRGVTVKKTGLITRNAAIPEIGSDPKFNAAAFQLSSIGSTSDAPVHGSAGFYLLRLSQRKAPADDTFETEKEDITSMLLGQKQRILIQDWIDARKADSRVIIEKSFLE
ncbi:MAG: peptidyl-prolyl cis-trans isomerase, partial [Candidatus Krumholzibacteriia bacterium]